MSTPSGNLPSDESTDFLPESVSRNVNRWQAGDGWRTDPEEPVATEYPLTLYLNDHEIATLVCTPSDLRDLTLGFLTAEGFLRRDDDWSVTIDRREGMAFVEIPRELSEATLEDMNRRIIGSCCGKSRSGFYFANDAEIAREVTANWTIEAERLVELMDGLHRSSGLFVRTAGVHNAAFSTPTELVVTRTDIGRHNTLDKLFGYSLEHDLDPNHHLIVFSGRISSEILLKVSKMDCPILVSTSAPTDLALNLAEQLGITAVGFTRADSFNLYTHPERIAGHDSSNRIERKPYERKETELV